jgi:hypothetical protein
MNQNLIIILGILVVLFNLLSFGIAYSHGINNGLNWKECGDDVTVSESLLLLSSDAGFATSMAILSAVFGAILLYNQFANHDILKYIISFLYLIGMIFFSTLPFVVTGHIPPNPIDPIPAIPSTNVTQIYDPDGHRALAILYGFCMCICIIISTWVYVKDNRDRSHQIALYSVVGVVFCLLISFLGSLIDFKMNGDTCTEKSETIKWFTITEILFLIIVNIWIIIIASPYKTIKKL